MNDYLTCLKQFYLKKYQRSIFNITTNILDKTNIYSDIYKNIDNFNFSIFPDVLELLISDNFYIKGQINIDKFDDDTTYIDNNKLILIFDKTNKKSDKLATLISSKKYLFYSFLKKNNFKNKITKKETNKKIEKTAEFIKLSMKNNIIKKQINTFTSNTITETVQTIDKEFYLTVYINEDKFETSGRLTFINTICIRLENKSKIYIYQNKIYIVLGKTKENESIEDLIDLIKYIENFIKKFYMYFTGCKDCILNMKPSTVCMKIENLYFLNKKYIDIFKFVKINKNFTFIYNINNINDINTKLKLLEEEYSTSFEDHF